MVYITCKCTFFFGGGGGGGGDEMALKVKEVVKKSLIR